METKICSKCKVEKPISDFYKSKRDKYRSRCKTCEREDIKEYAKTGYYKRYNKRYYKTDYWKEWLREYNNQYWKDYRKRPNTRIKILARGYVNSAIQSGKIKKEPCVVCGQEQAQVHHPDYNQPLLILWLCPNCHKNLHEMLKSKGG